METIGVSVRRCLQNFKGRRSAKSLIFCEKTGAGEGIRTLDPNLGNPILRATPELTILRFSTPFQMDIAIAATTQ